MSARRGTATIPRLTPRRCMKRSWHSSTGKSARQEPPTRLRPSAPGDFLRRLGMREGRVGRLTADVPGLAAIARIAMLLAGCLLAGVVVASVADEIPLADFAR